MLASLQWAHRLIACTGTRRVCFTLLKADKSADISGCELCAGHVLMRRGKKHLLFDHLAKEREHHRKLAAR